LEGINGNMMAAGIKKMIKEGHEWPPSAPAFRMLCLPTPEDYGLVDEETAFQMAVGNRTGKTPEVIECLRRMGPEVHTFRREAEDKAKRRWSIHYTQLLADVVHGFEIPQPEEQIQDQSEKTLTKAENLNRLQSMKALFEGES
jgi:hypothetical protein